MAPVTEGDKDSKDSKDSKDKHGERSIEDEFEMFEMDEDFEGERGSKRNAVAPSSDAEEDYGDDVITDEDIGRLMIVTSRGGRGRGGAQAAGPGRAGPGGRRTAGVLRATNPPTPPSTRVCVFTSASFAAEIAAAARAGSSVAGSASARPPEGRRAVLGAVGSTSSRLRSRRAAWARTAAATISAGF
jgi:hypothetical protein